MDEYIGIHAEAPQSFGNFLRQRIFDKVPFKTVNYLNGQAENLEEECKRYSELLLRHPVDIVCLGIGENGHIAFNDPDVANFNDSQLVKVVELDPICRQQQVNEKCFETFDLVPAKALTLTIPALLKADWMFCIVPFKIKPMQYIIPFMEKFPKNVRPVYYAKKKILVYIWILKVQNE